MVDKLIFLRKKVHFVWMKKVITKLIRLLGCVVPMEVIIGDNVQFIHDALGSVIHEKTQIGNNVRIFQSVTIGKKDIISNNTYNGKIIIEDGVTICAGAKILAPDDVDFHIGKNAVIAANAVVINSVPPGEVWGGIPAKQIK